MSDTLSIDERFAGVLEPDTMLPSQFFAALRQKGHLDGERRLMIAVLEDAVNCFQKHVRTTDPKARELYADAEEWILSADQSWFFSFANVCDTLDLDPDYVREGLRRWRERAIHDKAAAGAHREEAPVSFLRSEAEDGSDEADEQRLRKASA